MIVPPLIISAALAAAISTLALGPASLSLPGIDAVQERGPRSRFIPGHLVADILWSLLVMMVIIGARYWSRYV
jgi:hypothetical protein